MTRSLPAFSFLWLSYAPPDWKIDPLITWIRWSSEENKLDSSYYKLKSTIGRNLTIALFDPWPSKEGLLRQENLNKSYEYVQRIHWG